MIVASSRTAAAIPEPGYPQHPKTAGRERPKAQIMMTAAEVLTRPVAAGPFATAPESAGPLRYSPLIWEIRKTW